MAASIKKSSDGKCTVTNRGSTAEHPNLRTALAAIKQAGSETPAAASPSTPRRRRAAADNPEEAK